jgi:hypothetical protein
MSTAPSTDPAHHATSRTFGENATEALADGQLRGALRQATTLFGERRGQIGDLDADLRHAAAQIRNHAVTLSFVHFFTSRCLGIASGVGAPPVLNSATPLQ